MDTLIAIVLGGALGSLLWVKGRGFVSSLFSKKAEAEVKKLEDKVQAEQDKVIAAEAKIEQIEVQVEKEKNAPQTTSSLIDFFTNRYKK